MSGRNFISNEFRDQLKATVDTVDNLRVDPRGKTRRRIRTQSRGGGGGAERPYVIITAVIDAATYTGNVLDNPVDQNVTTAGVSVLVPGATSNDYSVGATGFCDLVNDVYYLSGGLLN